MRDAIRKIVQIIRTRAIPAVGGGGGGESEGLFFNEATNSQYVALLADG